MTSRREPQTEAGRQLLAMVNDIEQPYHRNMIEISVEFLRDRILAIEKEMLYGEDDIAKDGAE